MLLVSYIVINALGQRESQAKIGVSTCISSGKKYYRNIINNVIVAIFGNYYSILRCPI